MDTDDGRESAKRSPFGAAYSRQIRIFSESGGFPMWAQGGAVSARGAREDFGLDDELIGDLERWGYDEDVVYRPDGWEEQRRAEGEELTRRVQEQLGDEYQVVFLWP